MQRFTIRFLLFLSALFIWSGSQFSSKSIDLSSKKFPSKNAEPRPETDSNNPAKSLIGKITTLNTPLHEANAECDGKWPCNQAKPDLRYEKCEAGARNSYLEKDLVRGRENLAIMKLITPAHETDSTDQTQLISRQCIRQAMDMGFYSSKNKHSFKSCATASSKPQSSIRPCISANYFDSINNGFELVSRCMKNFVLPGAEPATQKQMIYSVFKMITMESGFHMNVLSNSGAGGLGQMTSGAIQDVNNKERAGVVRELLSSSSEQDCQDLAKDLLVNKPPMKSSPANACERISPANGNPLLNLLYSYAYFKETRQTIGRVTNDKRYATLFNLPKAEKEKLVSDLATWSHNTGPAGMTKPLIALLNQYHMDRRKVTDSKKFLKELEGIAYQMPHKANSSLARRQETSRYYKKMQDYASTIEKNLGVKSCLHE